MSNQPANPQPANTQPASTQPLFTFNQLFVTNQAGRRSLTGISAWAAIVLCIVIAIFHLYVAFIPAVAELTRNALHFAGFVVLCAMTYPLTKHSSQSKSLFAVDLIIGFTVAVAAIYLAFAETAIYARDLNLSTLDWIAGITVIIGAIEMTRRATGLIIPILIILALSYVSWLGPNISGVFNFPGLNTENVLFRSIYGDDALFGTIAKISSTYVFLFILFGAFLLRSGAGDFVVDISRAVAGRFVGGPGLVAVIASGLTGTISGSAIANTASTGVITIPMMKRAGFPKTFAAAVEAASSTGGQLMPPIMGAGAFVMASYTQLPYEKIVAVAALPALLYFLSVAFFVRIEAKKQGMTTSEQTEYSAWQAIKHQGASFIIPIALLITLLVTGYTATYAAVFSIIAVIVSSWLTKTPMGPKAILEALALGSKNMIMTGVLLCAVGLVVNVIATAGIGNTFSLMISGWADGNILIAIVLIGLASLVLGMGLPVTAAYIVLATLSAPALANMISDAYLLNMVVQGDIPESARALFMLANPDAITALASPMNKAEASAFLAAIPIDLVGAIREQVIPADVITTAILSAHMIIFWLSQDSNVTPPVCLASFTAAAIAKSPPMMTGFYSWKVAKGLYIVPILFAYTPILSGDWGAAFTTFCFAIFGIYAIAAALEGHMENKLALWLRPLVLIAGALCLWPNLTYNFVGVGLVVGIFLFNLKQTQKTQQMPSSAETDQITLEKRL